MNASALIDQLSEADVVALTLFGESRGEPIEGRIAIASVIRNRVAAHRASFGLTPRAVCLQPWQFSCWMPEGGSVNYGVVLDAAYHLLSKDTGPMLRECLWITDGALAGMFHDTVRGSTHYLTAALFASHPPAWAAGQTPACKVNEHLFFRGIK